MIKVTTRDGETFSPERAVLKLAHLATNGYRLSIDNIDKPGKFKNLWVGQGSTSGDYYWQETLNKKWAKAEQRVKNNILLALEAGMKITVQNFYEGSRGAGKWKPVNTFTPVA